MDIYSASKEPRFDLLEITKSLNHSFNVFDTSVFSFGPHLAARTYVCWLLRGTESFKRKNDLSPSFIAVLFEREQITPN